MKNDGKTLERIVRLVQETLKDSLNTEIFSNHKLLNTRGEKKEFDVVVKSRINDFKIVIAIECKDYKRPVSAEKIDAFESKCNRVKLINKKIFVSNSGYQSGAVTSAEDFGIELHTANKLSPEVVRSWFPIKKLSFEIKNNLAPITLYLDYKNNDLNSVNEGFKGEVIINDNNNTTTVYEIIAKNVNSRINEFKALGLIEWMQLEDSKRSDFFSIGFRIDFKGCFIIFSGIKVPLLGLETGIYARFREDDADILEGRILRNSNDDLVANTLSVDLGGDVKSDIIIRENENEEVFVTDKEGNSIKLDLLFTYDSKTGKFSKD